MIVKALELGASHDNTSKKDNNVAERISTTRGEHILCLTTSESRAKIWPVKLI